MQQSSGSECCSKCKTFGITSKRTFNVAAAAATALAAVATCQPELPPRIRHAHKASPSHSHSYSHSEWVQRCDCLQLIFNQLCPWLRLSFSLNQAGCACVCVWHSIWPAFWPARLCQLWHTYIAPHILQIICCVCGSSKATKPANWNCSCHCNWTGNKTQSKSKSHNRVESKLNSLNNCELQTKMQLGSKLIAFLQRNNANAQSNLNACEAAEREGYTDSKR